MFPIGQQPTTCVKDGCIKPSFTAGLCAAHYKEQREWGSHGAPPRFEVCPVCRERLYAVRRGNGMCCRCIEAAKARTGYKHDNGHGERDTCLEGWSCLV